MEQSFCMAIVGPTASGKTNFSLDLAEKLNAEIVCMDSTTVYRGFDIGSSKPTPADQARAKHHLMDILNPDEPFSAYHFIELAEQTIEDIEQRGKLPLIVGGTYFYLRALQYGMYPTPVIPAEVIEEVEKRYFEDDILATNRMYQDLKLRDPKAAEKIHPNDKYRLLRALAIVETTGELPSSLKPIPVSSRQEKRVWLKYSLALPRHSLNQNIVKRTEKMLSQGLIDETRHLREKYPSARALQSIGYHEVCRFLGRKITEKQLPNEIIEKTRQLAKRQMTWIRSDTEVRFVDSRDMERIAKDYENLSVALGRFVPQ